MICKRCGASIPDDSKFCENCTEPVEEAEEYTPDSEETLNQELEFDGVIPTPSFGFEYGQKVYDNTTPVYDDKGNDIFYDGSPVYNDKGEPICEQRATRFDKNGGLVGEVIEDSGNGKKKLWTGILIGMLAIIIAAGFGIGGKFGYDAASKYLRNSGERYIYFDIDGSVYELHYNNKKVKDVGYFIYCDSEDLANQYMAMYDGLQKVKKDKNFYVYQNSSDLVKYFEQLSEQSGYKETTLDNLKKLIENQIASNVGTTLKVKISKDRYNWKFIENTKVTSDTVVGSTEEATTDGTATDGTATDGTTTDGTTTDATATDGTTTDEATASDANVAA